MTTKEKIELLNSIPEEQFAYLNETIANGVIERDKKNPARVAVRFDLRAYIKKRLDEEGVSAYALGKRIGKKQPNMTSFMNGRIPLPMSTLEEILWLILPEEMLNQNYEQ